MDTLGKAGATSELDGSRLSAPGPAPTRAYFAKKAVRYVLTEYSSIVAGTMLWPPGRWKHEKSNNLNCLNCDTAFRRSSASSPSWLYITEIHHTSGTFHLNDRSHWRALFPRTVQHWRIGDFVARGSVSCGNDPNAYLLTDTSESESACAQRTERVNPSHRRRWQAVRK